MSDDDRGILGLLVAIGGVLGVCAIGAVLYFALVAPASEKLAKATGRATTKAKDLERQQINVEDLERRKDNLNRDAARLRHAHTGNRRCTKRRRRYRSGNRSRRHGSCRDLCCRRRRSRTFKRQVINCRVTNTYHVNQRGIQRQI